MSSWARLLAVLVAVSVSMRLHDAVQCILRLGVRWWSHAGRVDVADPATGVGWAL
jgi:hypothetical protein